MLLSIGITAHASARATWIVRFDIDTPEKVQQVCSAENRQQFDRYLVQVRGRADSWYESAFVPKAEGVDFDPLSAIIAACPDVEIHAWVNVYYLWTGDVPPEDQTHPYYNDEWILRDRTGRSVKDYSELEQRQRWLEGVYADPASTEYRAYFTKVIQEIVEKYDVAGVHLDFVRYPGSFFGDDTTPILSKITRQELAQWSHQSGDSRKLLLYAERLAWENKRARYVTSLVRDVKKTLTAVNPSLKLSASVFPDVVEAFLDKGQKWTDWLHEGLLDDVYIMTYFGAPERVHSQLRECKAICDGFDVTMWAGLGAYIKTAEEIQDEITDANQLGISDICLFSLGHLLKQKKNVSQYQCQRESRYIVQDEMEVPPLAKLVLSHDFAIATSPQYDLDEGDKTIKLRGIFRYVDTHDTYEKVQDQFEIMQKVEQELQRGRSFTRLSRQYSQAGTKRYGGRLPNLHSTDVKTKAMQRLFELEPGERSEIVPVYNGFWIFEVL